MGKTHWAVVAVGLLLGLLGWSNWQLRGELAQLQTASAAQSALITARPAPLLALPTTPRVECPPGPAQAAVAGVLAMAPPSADSKPVSRLNTTAVDIPPGTNLLEAIKIIQREQAKSQPSSAAASPFGAGN